MGGWGRSAALRCRFFGKRRAAHALCPLPLPCRAQEGGREEEEEDFHDGFAAETERRAMEATVRAIEGDGDESSDDDEGYSSL